MFFVQNYGRNFAHIFWEANDINLLYIPAVVKAEEKIVSEPASAKTKEKKVPAELVISKTEEKIVPEPASGNNVDKTVPKPASNVDKTVPEPAKTVLTEPAKTVPEPAIAKNEDETVVPVLHTVELGCHGINKKRSGTITDYGHVIRAYFKISQMFLPLWQMG